MGTISEVFGDTNSEPPTAWVNACTSSGVALPPLTMNHFDSVRKSTADFTNSAGNALVAIDINSAKKHAHSIMACDKFEKYTRKADGWSRNLPLVFDNISQEINLITVIDLLQIGGGFRRELNEETGRGASETIYFGCISLHISQTPLDARGVQNLTLGDISQHFGIPLFGKERPMIEGNTSVMVSDASTLRPLAELILGTLHDTGRRLEQNGFSSFADFVIKICVEKATAAHLVASLVNAFPSLRDAACIDGSTVYLFKNAQLIAYDIWRRFGGSDPNFAFPDISDMTVFVDNVVPARLQSYGIIVPCAAIARKIRNNEELSLFEATAMRAASVVAAQIVVDCIVDSESGYKPDRSPVNQAVLQGFWQQEDKDSQHHEELCFVCKNSIYF